MGSPKPRWTPEAVEMLHGLYGLFPLPEVTNRINGALGLSLTPRGVWNKADREGLKILTCQGYLSVREAARQLGCAPRTVHRWVTRLEIKAKSRNPRVMMLDPKDVERLRGAIGYPAVETVSTVDVARMLRVNLNTVQRMIARGELRAHRVGQRILVEVASVPRDTFGKPHYVTRRPRTCGPKRRRLEVPRG